MVAIANYHKLRGLKQHKFMLQFWKSEVWGSVGLKAKFGRTVSFLKERKGKNLLSFPEWADCLLSLPCSPLSSSKLTSMSLWPLLPSSHFLLFLLLLPSHKYHWDYLGPPWMIQDNLPTTRSLMWTPMKSILPWKIRQSQVPGAGHGYLWVVPVMVSNYLSSALASFPHLPHLADRVPCVLP